jgi:catechol 2,3-dioxygenase
MRCGAWSSEVPRRSVDHGVSEALYLADPDGNGVELCWDRPRAERPRSAGGELAMVTDPLDVRDLLAELEA